MTYHEGQAVLYKPLNVVAYIRRVNNRPEVSETQRNYQNEKAGGTGWQKCPVCNGTGRTLADTMVSMNTVVSCDVCAGKRS